MIKTNPKKVKDFFETSHQNIVIDDTRKDLLTKIAIFVKRSFLVSSITIF